MQDPNDIAEQLRGAPYDTLEERIQKVARHIAERKHIARNTSKDFDEQATRGKRAADVVPRFGGS